MSSGSYKCSVPCPCCGEALPVLVEWWYDPGSYYEPPDGETNVHLVFPDFTGDPLEFTRCPFNTEHEYTDEDIEKIWNLAEKVPAEQRHDVHPSPEEIQAEMDAEAQMFDEDAFVEFEEPESETHHMGPDQ